MKTRVIFMVEIPRDAEVDLEGKIVNSREFLITDAINALHNYVHTTHKIHAEQPDYDPDYEYIITNPFTLDNGVTVSWIVQRDKEVAS